MKCSKTFNLFLFFIISFLQNINLSALNLVLIELELLLSAYVAHRTKKIMTNRKLIEEIDAAPDPPPQCPTGKLRLHVRIRDPHIQETIGNAKSDDDVIVKVGTSPAMKTEGTKIVPVLNCY
jgi:E1A-binding protein p400